MNDTTYIVEATFYTADYGRYVSNILYKGYSFEEAQKVFNKYQSSPHVADHVLKFYIEYKYSHQITIDLAQKRYYNN